jgi:hypothetical protein
VEADLACGRHAEMVGELQALTGEFGFRERLWAALMTALYRSGRQTDALRAYQDLRITLGDLGIEPSTELRALEDAVLVHEPILDWHPLDPESSADGDKRVRGRTVLPTGTVTFLRSEIEGSNRLLEHLGEDLYVELLGEHHRVMSKAIVAHRGVEVSADAGSFFIVFQDASDAVAMALAAQIELGDLSWPKGATVRARMGLHTGPSRHGGDSYVGLTVHLAAQGARLPTAVRSSSQKGPATLSVRS